MITSFSFSIPGNSIIHGSVSYTSAFTAFFDKPYVLDSGVFTHMSIKVKFHSLSFIDNIPPVNIIDGISSVLCGKRVFHTTFLSLEDALFVPKFLISLLLIDSSISTLECVLSVG